MKHKNYEWIVAWAEGKGVQCKGNGSDCVFDTWADVENDIGAFTDSSLMFRIKPEKKKSQVYRTYLNTNGYARICDMETYNPVNLATLPTDFKQWIDKEWQYYEYEEEA